MSVASVVVSAAVIWRGDELLLTRRREGDSLAGMWEFPGGKLEAGEDPRDTARRECQEECGIEVRVRDILEVAFHRYPEKDVLLLFYDAEWVAGEVQHLEVADHAWVLPADLGRYPLPPADVGVVEKIQRRAALGGPARAAESLDTPGGPR